MLNDPDKDVHDIFFSSFRHIRFTKKNRFILGFVGLNQQSYFTRGNWPIFPHKFARVPRVPDILIQQYSLCFKLHFVTLL